MQYQIEVLTLSVTDVDASKRFYENAGFAVDVDWSPTSSLRVVQLTPPGSAASIQLGVGLTDAQPGSARSNYLVVDDIEAAQRELADRGVPVSDIYSKADRANWTGEYQDGPDPDRADYASFVRFADPDGNTWIVQERGHARGERW